MLPPEFLAPEDFGILNWNIDIYHAGLLFLSLLLREVPSFTPSEIVDGLPRQTAEQHSSPFAPAIARALRRHVEHRTPTALDFWRDIQQAIPQQ